MAREEILRFKWIADDCKTWDEVIEELRKNIEFVTKLKGLGCEILDSADGYLHYTVPRGKAKEFNKICNVEEVL